MECVQTDTEPVINIAYDESLINSNGWAKENITVTLSGNGEIKYCISSSECEPNEIVETGNNTKFITTEGTSYLCALTSNSLGNSNTLCQSFNLDKTLPTAGTANITGTAGSNGWYTSNVTISAVNGSDALSGHGSTTTNVSSITSNTTGQVVTITTTDLAGNSASRSYTIKIDKNTPTTPAITGGSTTWSSAAKTISVSTASTSPSGIAYYQYYISTSSTTQTGGSWINLGSGVTSVSISTNGTRYIYFRAVNNAGKAGTVSAAQTTKIDTTQPALKAKATSNTILQGTSAAPMNYFTITTNYNSSLSGGTTTCKAGSTTVSNLNTLAAGTYTLTCTMKTGAGKTTSASTQIVVKPKPVSFATDSWDTISYAVKTGNTGVYNVGDTKEVTLSGFGTFTVRLANKSTPAECSTNGFSQTACGFVVEFIDIIAKYKINSERTADGGWPASEMYNFVNSTIYDTLPNDLKNVMINTFTVSGGFWADNNFNSNDKLYLLAPKEIFGSNITADNSINFTRQLDYYSYKINSTSNSSSVTIKYADNLSAMEWWLRTAASNTNYKYYIIGTSGGLYRYSADYVRGVAPAFRIG